MSLIPRSRTGRVGRIAAAALVALALAIGVVGTASAHHATVTATLACKGTVTWHVYDWTTDNRNNQALADHIQVWYQLDGKNGWVYVGEFKFTKANYKQGFGGTFTAPDTTVTVQVKANLKPGTKWGDGSRTSSGPWYSDTMHREGCPTPTCTKTATATATETATATATETATATATQTATATATATQTATATATATQTATATATATQTATATATQTATATATSTESLADHTATPVPTPTMTSTATGSESVGGVTSQPSSVTAPPTSGVTDDSSSGGFPTVALLICLLAGGAGLAFVESDRRRVRR